jgi:centrosomal protein CEP120
LQAELNRVLAENVERERQCNIATQTKQRYKAQWTRALQEIAKLQQEQRHSEDDRLKREQKELAHMRLQYLAREERTITNTDRDALASIQGELGKLRAAAGLSSGGNGNSNGSSSGRQGGWNGPAPTNAPTAHTAGGTTDELRRLIEERSTLLESGVYAPDDRIINELDRRIEHLMPR